jgi:hypothetical protein
MVKEMQPLSVEEVADVQLEGGADGAAPDAMAEKRRNGWWCTGCCYMLYAGIFGGLIGKNFVQFLVFAVIEPHLWSYFWGIMIIWISATICYCITGCCNSASFAKFLEPTCVLTQLGLACYGAAAFFGNPVLPFIGGKTKKINTEGMSLEEAFKYADVLQAAAKAS